MSDLTTAFLLTCQLAQWECTVLWLQGDVDKLLVDSAGNIKSFGSTASAEAFARVHGLPLPNDRNVTIINLDWIRKGEFDPDAIQPARTLDAWNFFADVAASVPQTAGTFLARDRKPSPVYDKVFWGTNLPAVTPPGEQYLPDWSLEEAAEIASLMRAGLDLFLLTIDSEPGAEFE